MKKFYLRKITSITTSLAMVLSNFTIGFAANDSNENNTQDPVEYHFSQDGSYYEKLKNGDGDSTYNPKARTTTKFGQSGSPMAYITDSKGASFRFPKKVVVGTNQEAFCLDHGKNPPDSSGVSYSKYGQLDGGLAYIMSYKPNTGDSNLDYYIKQGAVHYYLGESQWIANAYSGKDVATKIINLAKEAVTYKNSTTAKKASLAVSNTSLTFTQNGDYYETPYVNVTHTGNLTKYNVTVTGGLNGVQILDQNGNAATMPLSKSNTKFKLRVPKANVTGSHTANISVQGTFSNKIAEGYSASSSSLQRMGIVREEETTAKADLTANVDGLGSLTVIKKDDSGNKLKGAKFKLQQNNQDVSEVKTTDANGVIKFENLKLGTYSLVEVSAPQGFAISVASQNVNVTSTSTSVEVINSKIKGRVRVLKVDSATNVPLEGAVFELKDANGKVVETLTTGKDGVALSGLHVYGEYTVVEKTPPQGYLLNSTPQKVSISNNMTTVELKFANERIKGYISLLKLDAENADLKLEGVEFSITNKDGAIVDTLITDKDGFAKSKLLDYGTYIVKEIKSADGYKIEQGNSFTVEIKEHNKVYHYDVKNNRIKGQLQIIKIDSQKEDSRVEGAGFDIIAENVKWIKKGTVVDHIVTDKDGIATSKPLYYGTYKIIETKTPVGFWDSDQEYFIDILEDNKVYIRHITNDPIQAKLRIIKTDGTTKQKLEGVRFKIVNKETGEDVVFKVKETVTNPEDGTEVEKLVDKVVFETDSNGEIQLPEYLRFGTYSIVEVEPKDGYILAEPIDITINKETQMEDIEAVGTTTTQWVENQRITGSMELLKVDAETKKPLANVEFKVECTDGLDKGATYQITSNEEGIAKLENIPYGAYSLVEVQQIEGYVLNTKPISFEIKNNGETIKLEMENKFIKGQVEIIKTDSKTGEYLKGAEFVILNGEGSEVAKLVTDENGYAKSESLPFGFYQLKETKSPESYQLSNEVIDIEIADDGHIYTYEITNDKIEITNEEVPAKLSNLEVLKINSKTKQPLKGVEFQLLDANKNAIAKNVTNNNGIAVFEQLKEGVYYLKETKGLDGYILLSGLVKVNVGADGELVKVTVENQPKLAQTGGNFNFNTMIKIGALAIIAATLVFALDNRNTDK